jgi:transcriptional regulator with XRE-family HTH domain
VSSLKGSDPLHLGIVDNLAAMTTRSFGQIVREARLERHLSMGQLAAAVDRSTASVRRWERDDGVPTPDVVEALVERLDLDRDEVEAVLGTLGEPSGPSEPAVEAVDEPSIGEGDPIDVVPLVEVSATPASAWRSTPPPTAPTPPPLTTWATASVPVAVIEQDQTFLQVLRDPDKPWLGYIRAALTIVTLLALAWVLLWALPQFLDAFGELWDSLWQTETESGVLSLEP